MKKITFIILAIILIPASIFSQCIVKMSGGETNTIAQRSDGTLWFWGRGENGQSGTGNTQDHYTPIPFANSVQVVSNFEAGYNNTFIIKPDGSLWAQEETIQGNWESAQLSSGTIPLCIFPLDPHGNMYLALFILMVLEPMGRCGDGASMILAKWATALVAMINSHLFKLALRVIGNKWKRAGRDRGSL